MSNYKDIKRWERHGKAAIRWFKKRSGEEYDLGDVTTPAIDLIANILHAVRAKSGESEASQVSRLALDHFENECWRGPND